MNLLQQHRDRYLFNILLCAFLLLNVSTAQLREPFLQHITVEEGLSQSSVYCILQDRQGFLWFGTGDGLNKYDGYEITVYRHHQSDKNSLSDNTIRSLMEDNDGNLWIGTNDGLNKYEPRTGKFSFYDLKNVESLFQDSRGTIWASSYLRLLQFNTDKKLFEPYVFPTTHRQMIEHQSVKSLFEDKKGNIWMGKLDGVDVLEKSGSLRCLSSTLNSLLGNQSYVSAIAETREGDIWFATMGKGLFRMKQNTEDVQQISINNYSDVPSNELFVSSLLYDGKNTLWIGTKKSGVLKYDIQTEKFSRLLDADGYSELLTTYDNRYIMEDRSGLLWIGTDGDGVYKYDPRPRKFKHLFSDASNRNSLSGNFLKSIYEDRRQRVWIGTYEYGLTMWDKRDDTFKQYLNTTNTTTGKGETVYAVTEDAAGTIFFGTERGLARFDERTEEVIFFSYGEGMPNKKTIHLLPSTHGWLWATVISNLYKYRRETNELTPVVFTQERYPSMKGATIVCLFEDSHGILWFGTYDGGLNRYDPTSEQCTTFVHDKNNLSSLSHNGVKVIYESRDGLLWIGTGHGLNTFEQGTSTFTRYFEEDGLPSAYIYGILEDGSGNLWLSTNKGISKFNPTTKQFRNYGVEDGLQSNEFNSGACFKNRSGEMYFGGINGMNVFHPDSVRDNPSLPNIVLTGYKKLDLPVEMNGEISTMNSIVLEYEEGIFSLRFAALEYSNPEKNQYAYILEGFEQNWVYSGTRREVRYTHLDPGEYVFRVKGSNNDGVWNEEGFAITVVVVPPFWRTWWFLSLTGIVALISVGGTIRFFEMRKVRRRVEFLEREREMERERARISQDMHDEIGASLTQIAILSEIARRELDDRSASERHLQKISNTARGVVDSISEIVWAINPKNDSLDNLISFIREYAAGLFEGTETRCLFSIPDTIPVVTLSGEHRRNIFLVVKESLNNIMKHAQAGEVHLRFSSTVDTFSIVIQDNGKGFCIKEISVFSNGLSNMKRRMESIGGTFTIESIPHVGTIVQVHFKLNVHES
ncbi:MAG: hypothetical protein HY960_07305 [Ignavibacteriae bacterium]|nr:hypothetical protein [Ignavibacteriota bacterium]